MLEIFHSRSETKSLFRKMKEDTLKCSLITYVMVFWKRHVFCAFCFIYRLDFILNIILICYIYSVLICLFTHEDKIFLLSTEYVRVCVCGWIDYFCGFFTNTKKMDFSNSLVKPRMICLICQRIFRKPKLFC